MHPVFHVSVLTCYHASDPEVFPDRTIPPPPPTILDETPEYEVEAILNKCIYHHQVQYLVKWLGYPEYDASWEPAVNLTNSPDIVTDFEHRLAGD